jgi:hypothetical protein
MFKPKPSMTKPAEKRLQKVAVKRARAARVQRAKFLSEVRATLPTETTEHEAVVLVGRVRAAKSANFLQQYRITA